MSDLPAVLLVDLDDTILDDTGARDWCWRRVCAEAEERYPDLDGVKLLVEIEDVRDWFWSDPDRHREWRPRMREAWTRIASDALARLGVNDPRIAAFIGDRHFELRDAAIRPLPGAVETLERPRDLCVVLGLITNGGGEGQRAKIERFASPVIFNTPGLRAKLAMANRTLPPTKSLSSSSPLSRLTLDGRR